MQSKEKHVEAHEECWVQECCWAMQNVFDTMPKEAFFDCWVLKIYSKVQHFFVVSSLFFVVVNICVVSDSSKGFLVLVLLMIITTLKPCLHLGFTFHMVFSITMSSSSMVLQVLLSYITHIVTYDIHFNLCKQLFYFII